MDAKLAALFARKQKEEREQDEDFASIQPQDKLKATEVGPARRPRDESSAKQSDAECDGMTPISEMLQRPATVEEGTLSRLSQTAAPVSGAAMAQLNAGNAELRQAAVGAGRLFSRPTPAQLLRGNESAAGKSKTGSSRKSTLVRAPAVDAQRCNVPVDGNFDTPGANATLVAGEVAVLGTVPASSAGATGLHVQNKMREPVADDTMVGAGQLFKRPSPAELLKRDRTLRAGVVTSPEESLPPQPPTKSPVKSNKVSQATVDAPHAQTLNNVKTQPKATSKKVPTLAIHPDDVQIGKLHAIPEGDELEWTSASEAGTPREQGTPRVSCHFDQKVQSFITSDTNGKFEHRDKEFAGVGSLVTDPSISRNVGQPHHAVSTKIKMMATGEIESEPADQKPKGQAPSSASVLAQLPLIKLESQHKKLTDTRPIPVPRYSSMQEADAAREAEVIRRQKVFQLLESQPSTNLPVEIEGVLTKGITDSSLGKHAPLEEDDSSISNLHGNHSSEAHSSVWTDFARERAKGLGQAVDDADAMGTGKANLKLKTGVNDVLLWLRNIGWGQYEDAFAINQIDFEELFVLQDRDLQEMGMKLSSNRLMLLHAIAALKQVFQTQPDNGHETVGVAAMNQNVFIDGRDKRESKNAELIADQVNFEQRKGYLTWSGHDGKKWKRGYAVIQGSLLHIFKTSDHVVLKPVITKQLEGSLISESTLVANCIYLQMNSIKMSKDDIYLCAADEEERDAWLQHLVAAASLQLLRHVMIKNTRMMAFPPIIVQLDAIHINKTGPYASPHFEINLADRNGVLIATFNDVKFADVIDEVQPNSKGSISQGLSGQITLHKKLREDAGPGAILFFEFKHTSREKNNAEALMTQYWSYAFVDTLQGGELKLDLMKRPVIYDPALLKKGSLTQKDKSFMALSVHIKPERQGKTHQLQLNSTSITECSRALVTALQAKMSQTDEVASVSLKSLETILESLHVLDSTEGFAAGKGWGQAFSSMNACLSMYQTSGASAGFLDEKSILQRITQLEGQLAAAKGELEKIQGAKLTIEKETSTIRQWAASEELPNAEGPPRAPPPLGSGVPPPPPPPPGMATASKFSQLATADYTGPSPSMRMRPFHWKKLPTIESVGTFWSNMHEKEWKEIVTLLEPAKMEILFSANQTVRTGADVPPQLRRSQKTALIDLRRAQNVSIMLSKFRCTLKELKQAVTSLDTKVLDVENTAELLKFVPSDEELEILKAYTGDISVLGAAESFFLEVAPIPRYKERLQVHHFTLTFDDRVAELDQKFSCLIKCFTELTKCKRLHRFMLHVLAVGNFMNNGTSMGNAVAFRLEALNQAINIRSNVEGVTLLHFLASHINNTDPDLLNLPKDLSSIEEGATISLPSLSAILVDVKRGLAMAVDEHKMCSNKDCLKQELSQFLPTANNVLESVVSQHAKCQSLLQDAKALYAETRPAVTQEELCAAFSTFKRDLVSVIKDNEAARSRISQMRSGNDSFENTPEKLHAQLADVHSYGLDHSFSELAPNQSIFAGVSPRSLTKDREVAASRTSVSPTSPLEAWLVKNQLGAHLQVLKLNRVTMDSIVGLTDEDLQDLGIAHDDKVRMVKAISKLKRGSDNANPELKGSYEKSVSRSRSRAKDQSAETLPGASGTSPAPHIAVRSRVLAREGPVVWGVCYGEGGEPTKGQKTGWVEIQTRSKSWEKFYAKRARNTLVLFASDANLNTPVRLFCLDGVVVHRSDDRRAFVVEARKNIFQETKEDLFLAADSNKEAASWEKALIKGAMWHAEKRSEYRSGPASVDNGRTPSTVVSASVSVAQSGLTAEQVHAVGHTFTFKNKRSSKTAAHQGYPGVVESVSLPRSGDAQPPLIRSGEGVSLAEQVSPRSTPCHTGLALRLLQVELEHEEKESFKNPGIAITTTATVAGKLLLEPAADVQIRGLPADESTVMTIGVTRLVPVPPSFKSAQDLSVCLELQHQLAGKVITRAWTCLELAGIRNGHRRLQLHSIPVQMTAPEGSTPIKNWFVNVEVRGCDT